MFAKKIKKVSLSVIYFEQNFRNHFEFKVTFFAISEIEILIFPAEPFRQ